MQLMTTAQKLQKLEREVAELRQLFGALVPLDREGEYRASFVANMQRLATEKPAGRFSQKGDLLALR